MSGVNQSFRSYVVGLLIILMLSVFASYRVEIEIEYIENPQGSGSNGSSSDDGFSKPWESPMEELQRIAQRCDEEMPDFIQIAHQATASWKTCMDSINPDFSTSESTNESTEMEENYDKSTTDPSLIISEMPICFNTTAFKSCWLSVIAALNECEEGIGDVVGAIYFALYDDTCRDGGRLAIENQRKVAEEGEPCFRNYSTPECEKNKLLRNSNDTIQFHNCL
ncbi:unnamed protein product [Orchesella dallaii]|uniref:DUF19 domain-containing protein n=1 Tax=Orchesella dallaii TaxID=48710 RepID=A0ABP1PNT0_9HEXA